MTYFFFSVKYSAGCWPFRNVKDIRYRRTTATIFSKKSPCPVYSGVKVNNSHGSIAINQPTIQSSMDFPLQFHSRGYELSYVLTTQEHNRNHAEIPARWDLFSWLIDVFRNA